MAALKLGRTADGVGATFPNDVLARMQVGEGDVLNIVDVPEGVLLTRVDSDFATETSVARKVMDDNVAVLRALAK